MNNRDNPNNTDNPLFRALTRLLSGPIVDRRKQNPYPYPGAGAVCGSGGCVGL